MKRIIYLIVLSFAVSLYSQTSSSGSSVKTGSSSRSSSSGTFGSNRQSSQRTEQTEEMRGQITNMIASIIGSKLRHPDPEIRKQALMSLVSSMAGTREGSGNNGEGVQSIFYFNREGTNTEQGTGVGGATFIGDLYELLQDPDPEVRDLASVGIDILFNTEVTLLRFMQDEDPLVRKYATKIYTIRNLGTDTQRSGSDREYGYAAQLIALRTLLVRLKHEKDPSVRKVITDGIEQFLMTGGGESGRRQDIFVGVDQSIIDYLNDPNPVVRKNALIIISKMEYNPTILNVLLERLKVEQDEEIKTLIERTIETLTGGVREGGRGALPGAGGVR